MSEERVDDGTAASVAVALPLLGLFLLMPPIVVLFARGVGVAGVPLIVIYLFGVWAALIVGAVLLAWRMGHGRRDESADTSAPVPSDTA